MPNPSTIAMESEETLNETYESFSDMFVNTKPESPLADALQAALDDGSPGEAPAYVEFDVVVVPENTPDVVLQMMEALDEEFVELELGFEMTASIMSEAVEALAEEQAKVRDLTAALGHIGQRNMELEEQVKTANATIGPAIAEAAARALKARRAFDNMEIEVLLGSKKEVGDKITQEAADAEAALEELLTKAGLL